MPFQVTSKCRRKMEEIRVSDDEIQECFDNKSSGYLRAGNAPVGGNSIWWFISKTYRDRRLLVVFTQDPVGEVHVIDVDIPNAGQIVKYCGTNSL